MRDVGLTESETTEKLEPKRPQAYTQRGDDGNRVGPKPKADKAASPRGLWGRPKATLPSSWSNRDRRLTTSGAMRGVGLTESETTERLEP